MGQNRKILLCAGGTGGHLFPAQALAHELTQNGWSVHLATDPRAEQFVDGFAEDQIHIVRSATFSGRNPFRAVKTVMALTSGYMRCKSMIRKLAPACVVGFGGYPTVPPIMASSSLKIPIMLHEQNAVMGRANRFLHKRASLVAMGFKGKNDLRSEKFRILGNPVRKEVLEAAQQAYRLRKPTDVFRLLVFGGSQGAEYFSKVLPATLELMSPELRSRMQLVQQARPENELQLSADLDRLGVRSEVAQFFSPMAARIASADLVIARGGASTVSELAVIGRPSILVPYPFALDHDQAMNAAELEKSGGCKVIDQSDLTAERLAQELTIAMAEPDTLAEMAKAAINTGKPQAAMELAKLVEQLASGKSAKQL